MIRVQAGGHVWELPEPSGREGRDLYRACAALIGELGYVAPRQGDDAIQSRREIDGFLRRLSAHPQADEYVLRTWRGGTLDGEPVTIEALDSLPYWAATVPYDATIEAWARLGFFGPAMRAAIEAVAEKAATAGSEPPTTSSDDLSSPEPIPSS